MIANSINNVKNYIEESVESKLKEYREYEKQIDISWGGKKRLENLVSINLGMKFGRAEYIFKESLQKDKPKLQIQKIDMMYRAYAALIDDVKSQGFKEIKAEYKCYQFDKNKIAMVCDCDAQLPRLRNTYKDEPDVLFFSIEELFRCIPKNFMDYRAILAKRSKDVTFQKIDYKK